jgi:hypothetical protein
VVIIIFCGVAATLASTGTVRLAFGREDMSVMGEPIEQRGGELFISEDLNPLAEGQVGGHHGGAAFVAIGEQVEEQLATFSFEGNKPQLIDDK